MRKPFREILVALAGIAILGGIIWHFTPPKEPFYQGKPLSYWLSGYGFYTGTNNFQPDRLEAEQAVRALGTNSVPTLLRMIGEPESPTKKRLIIWVNSVGRKRHWNSWNLKYSFPHEKSIEAWFAFQVLGPQQSDLLPDLTKLYELNANPYTRQVVLATATIVSTNWKEMMPLITRALADTNDMFLRANAGVALAKIHAPSDLAVPILMRALKDSNEVVCLQAIYALGEYGADARNALPELQKILEEAQVKDANSKQSSWRGFGFTFGLANYYRTNNRLRVVRSTLSAGDFNHAAETATSKINLAVSKQAAKARGEPDVTDKEESTYPGPWRPMPPRP